MSQTAPLTSGQHVRILEAEPGTPDPKSLVYYSFFKGLTGTVIKSYPDETVAISVDRSSLPEDIRTRHEENEKSQRDRWLTGLSDEERNKLSAKEKNFSLRYTLLVATKHVVPENDHTQSAVQTVMDIEPPARKTEAELEAAEVAYLESKKKA